jgi:cystathionine beta-lyase
MNAGVLLEGGYLFVQNSDGYIRLNLVCPRSILEEGLKFKLFDYVNWYNNIRIHGSLDYKTPVEYR